MAAHNAMRNSVFRQIVVLCGACILTALMNPAASASPHELTASDFFRLRMRGFNLGAHGSNPVTSSILSSMRNTGANLVRILIKPKQCGDCDHFSFSRADWLYMNTVVQLANSSDYRVIIALAPQPGGRQARYWHKAALQDSIVKLWSEIAAHFKGNPAIAGFDLINEPIPTEPVGNAGLEGQKLNSKAVNKFVGATESNGERLEYEAVTWSNLARKLIVAIRQQDPTRLVIIEPAPGATPQGFVYQPMLPFQNVVYSVHFYSPHKITHQGLYGSASGIRFPSGRWNRSWLSAQLQPIRDFAARYSVPIYVGEFSIVRWAPGHSRINWLTDTIALFEAEHWPWTYQAYREFQGWSAEIPHSVPPDVQHPSLYRTDKTRAMRLLRSYFRSNAQF